MTPSRQLLASLLLVIAVSTSVGLQGAFGQANAPQEQQLKAAYLYNFAKFVEWPDLKSGENIVLCALGDASQGAALDEIQGRPVKGRTMEVQHISSASEIGDCHIVYVPSTELSRLQGSMDQFRHKPILTVGDFDKSLVKDYIITFVTSSQYGGFSEHKRLELIVNMDAVNRSGLEISSRLLGLARIIRD